MTSAAVQEEAATDEVVALAGALAPLPHAPARHEEEDDEEVAPAAEPADPGGEDTARVLPRQDDEFTCRRCFLVAHVSRRAHPGDDCCADCAR